MTTKQEQALAALLTHPTRKEAAQAAGITDRTLRSYFRDPEFLARYREAYGEIVEDAARQAQGLLQKSLATFEAAMGDDGAKWSERISAADRAAYYAARLDEQANIRRELDELREALHDQ